MADCGRWQKGIHRLFSGKFYQHTGKAVKLEKTTEPDGSVHCTVLDPRLWPTVTHYDAGKSNVRTYLLQDYTAALAQAHGVRNDYPDFSLEWIRTVTQKNIDPEFLQLT